MRFAIEATLFMLSIAIFIAVMTWCEVTNCT